MPRSLTGRLMLVYALIGAALRATLIHRFGPAGVPAGTWIGLMGAGAALDVLVALFVSAVPRALLALTPALVRDAWLPRFAFATLVSFGLIYEAAIEYFFFDEFDSRFNHIALDYLLYPKEVFENIYQSFDIGRYALEALGAAVVIALVVVGRPRATETAAARSRWSRALVPLALGIAAHAALWFSPTQLVEDRVANEIGLSGPAQLGRALWNASIDFDTFYLTLPLAEARTRAAKVLGFPAPTPAQAASPDFRLLRTIAPARQTPVRSIVVVLEESLGSDFVGCLGATPANLTPNLDRWATRGLLLTNLIATGNRTVRGIESTLCSMVPLPGDSIVKRPLTDRVDGLPTVLERAGYQTAFYYGGRGLFDNIRNFTDAMGYGLLQEQSDFARDAFRTAWGVADQYIFEAALQHQVAAKRANQKLFLTILSVSNHKPFLVPPGPWGKPGERNRHVAVKYADWALGQWLDGMQKRGLLEDTAVLVLGDHGARVYGSERIPIRSYRIPALFLVPDAAWAGKRNGRLCSQIDLPSTLLALAGLPLTVPFFGSSIIGLPEQGGRAFVQHNHEVGLLDDRQMAILSLRKNSVTYDRLPNDGFAPRSGATELENDAAAVFQTAHHLYCDGHYNTEARK